MQYKSRLSSKPPAPTGGVQMRIRRREITPSPSGAKPGSINPTSTSVSTKQTTNSSASKGLELMFFGTQDYSYGAKLRTQQMMKELLIKRALSPPPKRLTLRWRHFQATPSRLSMMSTA